MSTAPEFRSRDCSQSPLPIAPRGDVTGPPWLANYPPHTPPRLELSPVRIEQSLLTASDRFANRRALEYFRTQWTYAELLARVQLAAANLNRLGIKAGDRVLVVLPNSPEFVVAWFALHWLGAELVPVNPLASAKDLVFLCVKTQAKAVIGFDLRLQAVQTLTGFYRLPLLIVAGLAPHLPLHLRWPYQLKRRFSHRLSVPAATTVIEFKKLFDAGPQPLLRPVLSDATLPAVLQPTGGTTGTPKVAVLAHQNLHANVAQLQAWCGLREGAEVCLAVLPFFHVFGATVSLLSSVAGAATMLLQARFDAQRVCRLMHGSRPTVAPMVPMMFDALNAEIVRSGRTITGLRACLSGAAPLPDRIRNEFERLTGSMILEGYGLSEASPVTHSNPLNGRARSGSIGLPLPSTLARVIDVETGRRELPTGEVGELIVQGPQVMRGYLDDPEETAIALRDGWLYTGDLARMDADGYFTLVDRKKDLIITGGLKVYPNEVEAVLLTHPQIKECAVVGIPDDKYGEAVTAYVVAIHRGRFNCEKLREFCRRQLASYKVPRKIHQCDVLPTTFLGKVRRVDLRKRAA